MPFQVCNGAMMKCSFAMPPGTSSLIVLPLHRTLTDNQPAANINDHIPMVNIPSFGMCFSPANPMFVAATAAALGTPTPVPCIPITPAPWITGVPTVILDNMLTLDNTHTLMCNWAGIITFITPGEFDVMVP